MEFSAEVEELYDKVVPQYLKDEIEKLKLKTKLYQKRYQQSDKFKVSKKRYEESEKGIQTIKRYQEKYYRRKLK